MKRWNLRNVILLTLIAIACGVVFWGTSLVYNLLTLALTPWGLGPLADNLLMGIWMLAGPLAACLFRLPGAAFLSETIGSLVEMVLGSQWGIIDLLSGVVQGLGTEAGFAITGYHRFGAFSLTIAAVTGTFFTTAFDWFKNGYSQFTIPFLILLVITRLVSILIFSGWLPARVEHLVERSQILK